MVNPQERFRLNSSDKHLNIKMCRYLNKAVIFKNKLRNRLLSINNKIPKLIKFSL